MFVCRSVWVDQYDEKIAGVESSLASFAFRPYKQLSLFKQKHTTNNFKLAYLLDILSSFNMYIKEMFPNFWHRVSFFDETSHISIDGNNFQLIGCSTELGQLAV